MRQNFKELFSRMKPEAQERVNARSTELLQAMAFAGQAIPQGEQALTPDSNATPSDEANSERL
jgi:hypothetical protein